MLDTANVVTAEAKSIVAIQPKPAFQLLFEITTTREGNQDLQSWSPSPLIWRKAT